jgi:Domain of unknown function (DUF892)
MMLGIYATLGVFLIIASAILFRTVVSFDSPFGQASFTAGSWLCNRWFTCSVDAGTREMSEGGCIRFLFFQPARTLRRVADSLFAQVKSCLQRHNADTSAMKDLMGRFTGGMNALVTNAAMGDEAVKAGIADYAFENMEIVTYRTLIATANLAGDDETRKICEAILGQEQEMADWLGREMAAITHTFLGRSAIAAQAKR